MGWLCRRTNCSRHTWDGRSRRRACDPARTASVSAGTHRQTEAGTPGPAWRGPGEGGAGTWFMTATSAAWVQKQSCTDTNVRPFLQQAGAPVRGDRPSRSTPGPAPAHCAWGLRVQPGTPSCPRKCPAPVCSETPPRCAGKAPISGRNSRPCSKLLPGWSSAPLGPADAAPPEGSRPGAGGNAEPAREPWLSPASAPSAALPNRPVHTLPRHAWLTASGDSGQLCWRQRGPCTSGQCLGVPGLTARCMLTLTWATGSPRASFILHSEGPSLPLKAPRVPITCALPPQGPCAPAQPPADGRSDRLVGGAPACRP